MSFRDLKQQFLRRLPGRIGEKYEWKYQRRRAMPEFHAALDDCAGMLAIDLGANVGEFTRLMAKKAERVFAFEPDPWSLEQLREATRDMTNVEIVPAALTIRIL